MMTSSTRKLSFLFTLLYCYFTVVDVRRLRSVDRSSDVDSVSTIMNSVEFIWSTTTVAVGDTAVLHCSFDAIFQQLRTGSIDWFKDSVSATSVKNQDQSPGGVNGDSTPPLRTVASVGQKIASGKQLAIPDRRYRVYRPHNSALSVLIIRRTKKQDAGIYRCNLAGSTTRTKYMVLNVTESKIEAQTSPAKMIAKAGTDVTLWCNATGYPKPVVYWTREDTNRKLPDGNNQFWGNELYFEKASERDAGIYTCYLDNFVQPVVSYKFVLMVEDNPWNVDGSKMRFDSTQWYPLESPEPKPMRGRSYLLLCETRGSPQPLPSISWYRDGRALRNSKHFYIIEDTPEWRSSYTSSTLVIMRFMVDFQGNYTCVATNAFRMKKQTFQLSELASGEFPASGGVNGTTSKGKKQPTASGTVSNANLPPNARLTHPSQGRKTSRKQEQESATHLKQLHDKQSQQMTNQNAINPTNHSAAILTNGRVDNSTSFLNTFQALQQQQQLLQQQQQLAASSTAAVETSRTGHKNISPHGAPIVGENNGEEGGGESGNGNGDDDDDDDDDWGR